MNHMWPAWLSKNVLGFSLASVMSDASHEIAPLLLPVLITQLLGSNAAPPYVAFIGGASTAVASITGLYAGIISDRLINRKLLILSGYFLAGSLVGLLAFAHHWITIFILMTGAWIGRGLTSAPRNAILADTTEPGYFGRAFGFRQASDALGSVLAPLFVYAFSGYSIRIILLATLIPGILAFTAIYFLVTDITHAPQRKPISCRSFLDHQLPKPFFMLISIFFFFGLAQFNKSLLILRTQEMLSINSHNTAISTITLLYAFRNSVQIGSSYLMGAISDYMGRTIPLAIGGFGLCGIMCWMLTWPSLSLTYALITFFLSGFSAGTYMSLQKSMAADMLPKQVRGTGYGIITTLDSLASFVSSMLLGLLWTSIGPQSAFTGAAYISFISILGLFLL